MKIENDERLMKRVFAYHKMRSFNMVVRSAVVKPIVAGEANVDELCRFFDEDSKAKGGAGLLKKAKKMAADMLGGGRRNDLIFSVRALLIKSGMEMEIMPEITIAIASQAAWVDPKEFRRNPWFSVMEPLCEKWNGGAANLSGSLGNANGQGRAEGKEGNPSSANEAESSEGNPQTISGKGFSLGVKKLGHGDLFLRDSDFLMDNGFLAPWIGAMSKGVSLPVLYKDGQVYEELTPRRFFSSERSFGKLKNGILATGLGLGLVPMLINELPKVQKIRVVEKDEEYIDFFKGNILGKFPDKGKMEFVAADPMEFVDDMPRNAYDGIVDSTGDPFLQLKLERMRPNNPKTEFIFPDEDRLLSAFWEVILAEFTDALFGMGGEESDGADASEAADEAGQEGDAPLDDESWIDEKYIDDTAEEDDDDPYADPILEEALREQARRAFENVHIKTEDELMAILIRDSVKRHLEI